MSGLTKKFSLDYVPTVESMQVYVHSARSYVQHDRKPGHRIFVNRSLHLENIKYYGFDMDYTIAEYNSPQYEQLIFDLAKGELVKLGYPEAIREFQYDPSFPVRGLWYDTIFGNLLKVDAYGNILTCVHGFQFLKGPQIEELYPNKFLKFDDKRIYACNTLYHLPEEYLLACFMDYFTNSFEYTPVGHEGVKSGDLYMSYKSIYLDVRTALNHIHIGGSLKTETAANIQYYLKKNEKIPIAFNSIRASGGTCFLLTNSEYKYTDVIMSYLFDFHNEDADKDIKDRDWKSYFDIIICDARKPAFFGEGTVLRQVDMESGDLKIGTHTGPFKKGQVYSGGSCENFMELISSKGRDVLYFGDHIFGDILKSKKICGWRTFLIVPELIRELHVWTDKCQLFTELQSFDVVLGEMYKDLDSTTKEKPDITKIRAAIREVTHRMDLAYGMMGSVFRSGSRQTFFSDQVVRFADLYAATFTNIVFYPLCYMFRAPAMLMPHESTVAHEQRFQMEPIISRQRTSSMEKIYHKSLHRIGSVIPNIMPSVPKEVTHTHDDDLGDEDGGEELHQLYTTENAKLGKVTSTSSLTKEPSKLGFEKEQSPSGSADKIKVVESTVIFPKSESPDKSVSPDKYEGAYKSEESPEKRAEKSVNFEIVPESVQRLEKARERIGCGLKPLEIPEILSNEENEDMLQVPIINCEEFSTIDNNLPCYDDNEDCEDSIVENIKSKHEKLDEDDDDDDDPPVPVTNQEAKKCMTVLQRYFMQEGNEGSPTSALNTCADFVEVKCYKNKRQTTLDAFLH